MGLVLSSLGKMYVLFAVPAMLGRIMRTMEKKIRIIVETIMMVLQIIGG